MLNHSRVRCISDVYHPPSARDAMLVHSCAPAHSIPKLSGMQYAPLAPLFAPAHLRPEVRAISQQPPHTRHSDRRACRRATARTPRTRRRVRNCTTPLQPHNMPSSPVFVCAINSASYAGGCARGGLRLDTCVRAGACACLWCARTSRAQACVVSGQASTAHPRTCIRLSVRCSHPAHRGSSSR